MSSSFKGVNYFGSGPHRFVMGARGLYVATLAAVARDSSVPGSSWFGDLELDVIVTGRLVASNTAALWVIRDAIMAEAETPVSQGTLVALDGRSWPTMTLMRYAEDGPMARGRDVSVGYEAIFRKFIGT